MELADVGAKVLVGGVLLLVLLAPVLSGRLGPPPAIPVEASLGAGAPVSFPAEPAEEAFEVSACEASDGGPGERGGACEDRRGRGHGEGKGGQDHDDD